MPWTKWYYTISFYILTVGIVLGGQYISQQNGIKYEINKPPLYDVVHTYLPDMSTYYWLNTVLLAISVGRFLFLCKNYQECSFLICCALIVRAITISVTSEPSCIPSCQNTNTPGSWVFNSCFDFNYSGHMVCITIACICIIKDFGCKFMEKCWWMLYIPLSALWIAASRQHYSSDVILSLFIASLMSI